ncbi:hypothetical protein ONZ45_g19623 [Pleurotus djamor]|nr:hypothetical protein ONZ45_g19623 [Pleurotus djamor]
MFIALSLTFVLSALGAHAAFHKHGGLPTVYTKCTVPNTVALSFDDGPYIYMEDVSNALTAAGAKGTFFLNGNNYGCIYSDDNIRRIRHAYDQGHQIASHTWSHAHLNELNWFQVNQEMEKVDQALQRIVGVKPAFVRPPFGEYNDNVQRVAATRGQTIALWDFELVILPLPLTK